VVRNHRGDTDGTYTAASATAALMLGEAGGIQIGPEAAISYEKAELDGYIEQDTLSTAARFGDQQLESLTGRLGILAATTAGSPIGFSARISYERELDSQDRTIAITPTGAPISYTSSLGQQDEEYFTYNMSVKGEIASRMGVQAGVRGELGRGETDALTSFVGLSWRF
jgi:outer membrane lipase/esterase